MVSPAEKFCGDEESAADSKDRIGHPRNERGAGKPGKHLIPNARTGRRGGRADGKLSARPDGERGKRNVAHTPKVGIESRARAGVHGRDPTKVRVQPRSVSRC
jgi:hypothetical protein